MAKVAREMVEKARVNVDQLVELLVKNAAAELTTFYYYTILRVNLIGLDGEGLKEIAETARIEDRNHFEALVPRIYELGGKLPDDMKAFHDLSACPPARLICAPESPNFEPHGTAFPFSSTGRSKHYFALGPLPRHPNGANRLSTQAHQHLQESNVS